MELLTKEDVSEIAGKLTLGESVALLGYELRNKSEETLGYLGKHLTLTLNLSSAAGNFHRRLFLKTYEVRDNKEDYLGETGIFKREQDFYNVVVEEAKTLGNADWCPECYFSKDRVLVLEDLSENGFKMVEDGHGPWALDDAHLEQALKALASMHATSMLLEHRRSKRLPALYPTIFDREILYDECNPNAPTKKWIKWQIQDLLEGVQYLDAYSNSEKILINKHFEEQIMRIYRLSKVSDKYQNVLTHGDVWKNNLLFLYSKEGSPKGCKFVDFQFIRYAPPAHDVMHLLCYATKKGKRDERESYFLQYYYDNLSRRMNNNGMDVEEYVKLEEFLSSCKEYKELALIQSLLSLHYILGQTTLNVETESYDKYDEYLANHRKTYMSKFFKEDTYAEKVPDVFQEFIDTYILRR